MNWNDFLYYLGWVALTPGLAVGFWRIVVGPTTLDRMVGFDLLTITVVGLMILYSVHEGTDAFVELIIIATALTFFSTVAFFYYLSHLPATDAGLRTEKEND
jgi:multicomponent Na+:H+ antiporter subunit F